MLDKIATPNLSIYLSFFISTEHSLGGNNAVQNEINLNFCILKIWQILKYFTGYFHQTQTSEECLSLVGYNNIYLFEGMKVFM